MPFLEYRDLPEVACKRVAIKVPAAKVETFGFLLGREMSAIGSGHSEVGGGVGHLNDRWLAARSAEGWIAVVGVHDVRVGAGLGSLTVRILESGDAPGLSAARLSDVIKRIQLAEAEARSGATHEYRWGMALGPSGNDENLEERARHCFGGVYEWPGVTLAAVAVPYEGDARISDHVSRPFRVHRAWGSGSVTAPSWELAQRLADRTALRVALFLTLLVRTNIEPAQSAASIVQGDASDLDRLFPQNLHSAPGPYVPVDEAFAQSYGPSAPPDAPYIFKLPADAGELWHCADSLEAKEADAFWSALASYRTAWQLRHEFPSFGFVALVTAGESLIDGSTLAKCEACEQPRGLGRAFGELVSLHTGVPVAELKKFTNAAYDRRSRTVHAGALHGGELSSPVGRASGWAPDPAAQFEYREWPALEALVACTLLTWLRVKATS